MTARARCSAALLAAAIAVSSAVAFTSVVAAPGSAQTATPRFQLAEQSPWVAPGTGFVMRFDAADVPPGAEVAVTVHDALQSRTAFDASVDGGNLPTTRDRQTFPFDQLPVDPATGQRVLSLPTAGLGDNGVFPIEVDLRSEAQESLAHFVTHVVVAPVGADGTLTVGRPLNVAWVWPLQAEPAYVAGVPPFNPDTLADLALTGRLGRQAVQLLTNADVPLTLAPSPETLEAWAAIGKQSPELAAGADAVRRAATSGRNQVLAGPFVPLDLPSIARGNLQDVVTSVAGTRPGELTRGVATLEQFLGAHFDSSTALPGRLDATSLDILQSASVRQLVVDGDALVPVNEKYTPAHPYKLRTTGGDDSTALTVLATDDGLEQFLTGDAPPALRAAHLLAGLALVAGEQPSIERGVAIANPSQWDADNSFVTAVLAGLRGNPLLASTTVEGLLQKVPVATDDQADGAPVFRQLEPYSPPLPPVSAAQYAQGVRNRDAVEELVKSSSDQRVLNADRALATSLAAAWANPTGRKTAAALLDSIGGSVDSYLEQVEVQPTSTITITSSKAEIPISFRNKGSDEITVELQLQSDRLLFPEGNTREITLPGKHNTTVRVAVETRGSGTAPVRMTVTTAGGLPIGDPNGTTIKVRSSFVSGVGVFLTVGAIVFLVLWWGWDIHRRRKKRAREQHPTYRLAPPSGQPRANERPPTYDDTFDDRFDDPGVVEPGSNPTESETSLVRSSALVAVGTALPRVTGFARIAAIVYVLGASTLAGTYSYANEAPNIVYELLLGGVLTATLVPLFVRYHETHDEDAPSAIFTVAIVALAGITLVGVLAAPWIVDLYTLNVKGGNVAEQQELATALLRLLMPQMFFYGIAALATAMLNAQRRFLAAAFAPVLNNAVAAAVFLMLPRVADGSLTVGNVLHDDGLILLIGLGTTAGVVVMSLALLPPLARLHTHLRFFPRWKHPAVLAMLRLSGWTVGYVIANQIALLVVTILANGTDGGPFIYISVYAFFQLPHGLFAVSLMTTFTPEMASAATRNDLAALRMQVSRGIRLAALVVVPASAMYIGLARPIIVALLQRGSFDAADASAVSDTLLAFSVGLLPFSIYLFALRAFYARHDTYTPFWINCIENAVNIALAFPLYVWLGIPGLALAFVLAYGVAAVITLGVLRGRLGGIDGAQLTSSLTRIVAAGVVVGGVSWAVGELIGWSTFGEAVLAVVAGALIGGVVYLGLLVLLRVEELSAVRALVPARLRSRT